MFGNTCPLGCLVECHPERSEGSKILDCRLVPVPVKSLWAGVWILHSVQNDIATVQNGIVNAYPYKLVEGEGTCSEVPACAGTTGLRKPYRKASIRSRATVASRRTSSGTVIWLVTCPAARPSSTQSK